MFSRVQNVHLGLPRWGYGLLLASLIAVVAIGQAATALRAPASASRPVEREGPLEETEGEVSHESVSPPTAPRSDRPQTRSPTGRCPVRQRCRTISLPSVGRPLAVSGLPLSLPLRC